MINYAAVIKILDEIHYPVQHASLMNNLILLKRNLNEAIVKLQTESHFAPIFL